MEKGFSLIELLTVVVILGIIAAIGSVTYMGFIKSAKEKQATTGLSSIYLAQEEYRSMNGSYYQSRGSCGTSSDDSSAINTNLFGGDNNLGNENFFFCIQHTSGSSTYQANAYARDGSNDQFSITHTKLERALRDNVRTDSW